MREVFATGYGIGLTGTNNIAEAIAVIIGADKVIKMAKEDEGYNNEEAPVIVALLDSQIVVDMINKRSAPKNPVMRKLL